MKQFRKTENRMQLKTFNLKALLYKITIINTTNINNRSYAPFIEP